MLDKNKAAEQGSQINTEYNGTEFTQVKATSAIVKKATQKERILLTLLYHGSINSQEAEQQPIKVRHLNSAISDLANRCRLEIIRDREPVKGYEGEICQLTRYSIPFYELINARVIINQLRARRKALPINWAALRSVPLEKLLRQV